MGERFWVWVARKAVRKLKRRGLPYFLGRNVSLKEALEDARREARDE
jgi:hypothetical protein